MKQLNSDTLSTTCRYSSRGSTEMTYPRKNPIPRTHVSRALACCGATECANITSAFAVFAVLNRMAEMTKGGDKRALNNTTQALKPTIVYCNVRRQPRSQAWPGAASGGTTRLARLPPP